MMSTMAFGRLAICAGTLAEHQNCAMLINATNCGICKNIVALRHIGICKGKITIRKGSLEYKPALRRLPKFP